MNQSTAALPKQYRGHWMFRGEFQDGQADLDHQQRSMGAPQCFLTPDHHRKPKDRPRLPPSRVAVRPPQKNIAVEFL